MSRPTADDLSTFHSRRNLLAAGATVLLGGCSNLGTLDLLSQTFGEIDKGKGADYPRTREEVDALPYAQLGVSRGEGPRAILALADAVGEELVWVSSDRVLRTTGLRSDFARTVLQGPDLWDRYPAMPAASDQLERVVQVEPGEHPSVHMLSRFAAEQEERIDIMGRAVDTLRVVEDVDVPEWRWKARNTWWLSRQSPLAWRSVQYLTPDQPPLHIEMLKRPA